MINPEELILVSVDDHICEPREMFDAHVPAKYREQAPRVVEEDDGVEQWWYGDIRGRNIGLNAAAGKSREYFNLDASRYDEMRPGCYDIHERIRHVSIPNSTEGRPFWSPDGGTIAYTAADTVARLREWTSASGTDWALGVEARSRALLSDGAEADRAAPKIPQERRRLADGRACGA